MVHVDVQIGIPIADYGLSEPLKRQGNSWISESVTVKDI